MSDFTNERPETLKESTTPGPWEWYRDQGIISLRGPGGEPIATDLNAHDADVLASSRTWMDDLIEERRAHQRLRAEVGRLRDDYRTRPYPYGEVARTLTRILEAVDE